MLTSPLQLGRTSHELPPRHAHKPAASAAIAHACTRQAELVHDAFRRCEVRRASEAAESMGKVHARTWAVHLMYAFLSPHQRGNPAKRANACGVLVWIFQLARLEPGTETRRIARPAKGGHRNPGGDLIGYACR